MGHTFAEKVLARKAGLDSVVPGQIVTVRPDKLLTHDNTSAIARQFRKIGVDRVADPTMNVIVLDHVTPAANETYAASHKTTREFVAEQGITAFYDIGEGICHQVLPEKGHAWPGAVIVGSDSHTPTHGAFGAFAAGIGRTEAAAVMATGQIWLRVPESFRIVGERQAAAARLGQGRDPAHHRRPARRRSRLLLGRVRGRDDPRDEHRRPHGADQHGGRDGGQERGR